ncbi:MAG: peptidoglycan recognition protein family protein, partial [Candidatus Omnitrophica bacterium]|nr:peptidoglycan recognition protein family protein [Candidatus Omnitrophota bacterium]
LMGIVSGNRNGGWASANKKPEVKLAISTSPSSGSLKKDVFVSQEPSLTNDLSHGIKTNIKLSWRFKRFLVKIRPYIKEGAMERVKEAIGILLEKRRELITKVAKDLYLKYHTEDKIHNWFKAERWIDYAIMATLQLMVEKQYSKDDIVKALNGIKGTDLLKKEAVEGLNEIMIVIEPILKGAMRDLSDEERIVLKGELCDLIEKAKAEDIENLMRKAVEEKEEAEEKAEAAEKQLEKEMKVRAAGIEKRADEIAKKNPGKSYKSYWDAAKEEIIKEVRNQRGKLPSEERKYWSKKLSGSNAKLYEELLKIRIEELKELQGKSQQEISEEIDRIKGLRGPTEEGQKACLRDALFALFKERAKKIIEILDGKLGGSRLLIALEKACELAGIDVVTFKTTFEKMKGLAEKLAGQIAVIYNGHIAVIRGVTDDGKILILSGNDNGILRETTVSQSELVNEEGNVVIFAEKEVNDRYFRGAKLSEEEKNGLGELKGVTNESAKSEANKTTETNQDRTTTTPGEGENAGNGTTVIVLGGANGMGADANSLGGIFGNLGDINASGLEEIVNKINETLGDKNRDNKGRVDFAKIYVINAGTSGSGILNNNKVTFDLRETGEKALILIINPDNNVFVSLRSRGPPAGESRTDSTSSKNTSKLTLTISTPDAKKTLQVYKVAVDAQGQPKLAVLNTKDISSKKIARKAIVIDAKERAVIDDEHTRIILDYVYTKAVIIAEGTVVIIIAINGNTEITNEFVVAQKNIAEAISSTNTQIIKLNSAINNRVRLKLGNGKGRGNKANQKNTRENAPVAVITVRVTGSTTEGNNKESAFSGKGNRALARLQKAQEVLIAAILNRNRVEITTQNIGSDIAVSIKIHAPPLKRLASLLRNLTKGGKNDTNERDERGTEELRDTIYNQPSGRNERENRANSNARGNGKYSRIAALFNTRVIFASKVIGYLNNRLNTFRSGLEAYIARHTRSPTFVAFVAKNQKIIRLLTKPYIAPSVAGIAVTAIFVIEGLAGAHNLQGLTPLVEALITIIGGVLWLKSTMHYSNSTTSLSSKQTTPYLQQPGIIVMATCAYFSSMNPPATSIPAMAGQILGSSLLVATMILLWAALPKLATTTSRSIRSTAPTAQPTEVKARVVGTRRSLTINLVSLVIGLVLSFMIMNRIFIVNSHSSAINYDQIKQQAKSSEYRGDIEDALKIVEKRKPELYRLIKGKDIPIVVSKLPFGVGAAYRLDYFYGGVITISEEWMSLFKDFDSLSLRLRGSNNNYARERLVTYIIHEAVHAQRLNETSGILKYMFNAYGEEKIAAKVAGNDWEEGKSVYMSIQLAYLAYTLLIITLAVIPGVIIFAVTRAQLKRLFMAGIIVVIMGLSVVSNNAFAENVNKVSGTAILSQDVKKYIPESTGAVVKEAKEAPAKENVDANTIRGPPAAEMYFTPSAKDRKWSGIVFHHTGAEKDQSAEAIRSYHVRPEAKKGKGWNDIGYNFVIRKDGTVELGRSLTIRGAHALNGRTYDRNGTHIGICLTGNKKFTPAQEKSAKELARQLCAVYNIKSVERHHNKCPGPGLDVEGISKLVLSGETKNVIVDPVSTAAVKNPAPVENPVKTSNDTAKFIDAQAEDKLAIKRIVFAEAANESNDPVALNAVLNTYNATRKPGEDLTDTMKRRSTAYRNESAQYRLAVSGRFNNIEKKAWENISVAVDNFKAQANWPYAFHENYALKCYEGMSEEQVDDYLRNNKWGNEVDFEHKVKIGKEYYFPLKAKVVTQVAEPVEAKAATVTDNAEAKEATKPVDGKTNEAVTKPVNPAPIENSTKVNNEINKLVDVFTRADNKLEIKRIVYAEAANEADNPEAISALLNTYNAARNPGESLTDAMKRKSTAFKKKSTQYRLAASGVFNNIEKKAWENISVAVDNFKAHADWPYLYHENYSLKCYKWMSEKQIDDYLRKNKWGNEVDFEHKVKIGQEYYFRIKQEGSIKIKQDTKVSKSTPRIVSKTPAAKNAARKNAPFNG